MNKEKLEKIYWVSAIALICIMGGYWLYTWYNARQRNAEYDRLQDELRELAERAEDELSQPKKPCGCHDKEHTHEPETAVPDAPEKGGKTIELTPQTNTPAKTKAASKKANPAHA